MQLDDKTHYNHSQLEEFREEQTLDDRERLRNRRLDIKPGNPIGWETPLGHTYSIILEALAREDIDVEPNPREFLDYIREKGRKGIFYSVDNISLNDVSLNDPTFLRGEAISALRYMRSKGLSAKSCERLMSDIIGEYMTLYAGYSAEEIERDYPMDSELNES